jgi:addiction module RelB/DinJ family antitoxin
VQSGADEMEKENATATVRARVEPELKRRAEAILHELGLDLSSGIKIFLCQVVLTGGVPFDIRLPGRSGEPPQMIEDSPMSGSSDHEEPV